MAMADLPLRQLVGRRVRAVRVEGLALDFSIAKTTWNAVDKCLLNN